MRILFFIYLIRYSTVISALNKFIRSLQGFLHNKQKNYNSCSKIYKFKNLVEKTEKQLDRDFPLEKNAFEVCTRI